jgi:phosphoribosyl-ATP pyrophosphohydrolase
MKTFSVQVIYWDADLCIHLMMEASSQGVAVRDVCNAFDDADEIFLCEV